jgi:hypothetical protein
MLSACRHSLFAFDRFAKLVQDTPARDFAHSQSLRWIERLAIYIDRARHAGIDKNLSASPV